MNPAIWAFIGTLIGAILVTASSVITTLISTRNSTKNHTILEKYKRDELFREFQRNNYLELQDILSKTLRLVSLFFLEDIKNHKITGEWQKSLVDNELDTNLMISFRDFSILSERVQNDNLRAKLKQVIMKMGKVSKTESLFESKKMMIELNDDFSNIMNDLGIELRKSY
jgi:hypothetical protein